MFYLAIVTRQNMLAGVLVPCYILCKSHGKSQNRSGWRVHNMAQGKPPSMPKLLVDTMEGHDEMLNFLAAYRARDHMHRDANYAVEETRKYQPVGALFWFECDRYGKETGLCYFVHRVPVPHWTLYMRDKAAEILKRSLTKENSVKEILTVDPFLVSPTEWQAPPWGAGYGTRKRLPPEARLDLLAHFGERLNWGDRRIPREVRRRWQAEDEEADDAEDEEREMYADRQE